MLKVFWEGGTIYYLSFYSRSDVLQDSEYGKGVLTNYHCIPVPLVPLTWPLFFISVHF